MRFDVMVDFWDTTGTRYDPDSSETVHVKKLVASILANVTDMGTQRSQQLLGSFTVHAKVVRLVVAPPARWSYCTVGISAVHYQMETVRKQLNGNVLILGEDGGASGED